MAERKRAATRRSLTAAASTESRPPKQDDVTAVALDAREESLQSPKPVDSFLNAPAESASTAHAQHIATAAPKASRAGTKYTAVLDDDTQDAFEQLTRIARRRLGRHVDKVEVLSTLLLLAADDVSLNEQIVAALSARTPPKVADYRSRATRSSAST